MKRLLYIILIITRFLSLTAQEKAGRISLLADTVHLKEVTVSSVLPLNSKQIEKFYKTNYFSTIDNLTAHLDGIFLIKRGAYAMEPQMNGFSGGQLNITINGMKMFGACTDKMDPVTSYIEPVNLKAITLLHGTSGSIHGNNIGGSIDMALQEPDVNSAHPFYSTVSYGFESASSGSNILLSTGYTNRKWEWGLNAVYRKNGDYSGGGGKKVPFSQYEKSNIHSVLKFITDSTSFFKADLLYDLAQNVGYPALPMDVRKARASIFALEYRRIKPLTDITAKVYYNSVYHVMDDSRRDSLFFTENRMNNTHDSVIMRMDMPGWSKTFGAFVQMSVKVNPRNKLIIKADNYINNSLAEMTMNMHFVGKPAEPPMYLQTWPDILRTVTGIFLQNTTSLTGKASLAINTRVDYDIDNLKSGLANEQFAVFNYKLAQKNDKLTGALNVSFQYRIFKSLLFSLQSGISERIPTISELYGFYLYNAYDGYDYIGNPYLKTEKSISAIAAVTYFNKGLKINLSQSINYMRDYIMGVTNYLIPPMNFYTNGLRVYNNLPRANIKSTDLQIMYSPLESLSFFMLTKYTRGKLNSGEPLPLIPPLRNTISASYERNKLSFQIDNETSFRQSRINRQYGEKVTPSFTIFNVKTSYHFLFKQTILELSIGITNLLDRNYYEHLDWGGIPRPGRSFNFFVKYKY